MFTLIVRASFEAAHNLPDYPGKCSRVHGHSYRVEAEFSGRELDSNGLLRDFTELKAILNEFLPDHTYLNEVLPGPTSTENIAKWIYEQLALRDLPVSAVTVWETDKNGCRYTPE